MVMLKVSLGQYWNKTSGHHLFFTAAMMDSASITCITLTLLNERGLF